MPTFDLSGANRQTSVDGTAIIKLIPSIIEIAKTGAHQRFFILDSIRLYLRC